MEKTIFQFEIIFIFNVVSLMINTFIPATFQRHLFHRTISAFPEGLQIYPSTVTMTYSFDEKCFSQINFVRWEQ